MLAKNDRWNLSFKNRMIVITLWRVDVKSLTTSASTMRFLIEVLPILKAIKSHFKGSYDKQNLTLVVISYEIYETRQRLVINFTWNDHSCKIFYLSCDVLLSSE